MFSFRLNNWPILTLVEADFISKMRMAVVYGNLGDKALIVTNDDMVYALGTDANRHSETDDSSGILGSMKVEELCGKGIKTFALGTQYVLALTKQGQVYSWGFNESGELGNECHDHCKVLTPIKHNISDEHIVDIACGSDCSVALTNKGEVYSWTNISGSKNIPRKVKINSFTKRVTSIACGKNFNIVSTNTGEVYSWGNNSYGQLGTGDYSSRTIHKVLSLNGIVIEKVVCGSSHVIALSTEGFLYAWGANHCGQLGVHNSLSPFNKTDQSALPVQVTGMEIASDIAASYTANISMAITKNGGNVFIWGQCRNQCITVPTCSLFNSFNEAFAYYKPSYTTYEPLIFHGDEVVPTLIDCFREAFNDSTTSDLVIKVNGEPIHVHKAVLKIRCPYLKTKVGECWDKNNESVIEIKEFSTHVYVAFLQYLYTNEINLSVKDIAELYNLANTYSEDELKNLCMFILTKEVTVQNVIVLYNKAIKYKAQKMEEYCFNFAASRMNLLIKSNELTKLDDRTFRTLVVEAVKTGGLDT